jgi:hypothetical protein
MAGKYTYYIDWGAGYVEVDPYKNKLKLEWRREFNDFISRKRLSGNFSLIEDEADDAELYYITNGNYEAPIKIYENGTSVTGDLIYEGWARLKGSYDFSAKTVALDSFRTNDVYTELIPYLDIAIAGNNFVNPDVNIIEDRFTVQGLGANSSEIQGYTYSSPNWSTTGNAFPLTDIGRCDIAEDFTATNTMYVYDNSSKELRTYLYSAPNWSKSANGFLEFP